MLSGFAQTMQSMAPLHFSLLSLSVAALTAYLFYLIWRNFHRARIIEDTPTARMRSAAQGYVELEGHGRALADASIVAPLTGTACLWFRFKVEKEKQGERSGSNWTEVESGISETPFQFFDETGECLVDPRKAEVTPDIKKVWYGSSRRPGGPDTRGLLGVLVGSRYRYTEERIETHATLYILGWLDTLRSTDTPLATELSTRLRAWKADRETLLRRFDSNRDGSIDEQEWQAARSLAQRELIVERAARAAQAPTNVLRASPHSGHPYLISARAQPLLAGRYRRYALFSLLGSMATAAFLAWMLVARF